MNSVIIHKLRMRKQSTLNESQGQNEGQMLKALEKQIFAILLLVAFSFFILVTPLYAFSLYSMLFDYTKSPERFSGFYLFNHIIQKMYFTNNAINFFLYVISGHKFRNDLLGLFRKDQAQSNTRRKIPDTTVSVIESQKNVWSK